MSIFQQINNDVVFLRGALRTLRMTTPIAKHPTRIFPDVIEACAARFGDRPALISDRETFTYAELAARANRFARWAQNQNIAKGHVVCLLMPNRPEYLAIWLGIIHAGGVVALLNTNLTGQSLAHCINIVSPRHVIVAAEMTGVFATARNLLATKPELWSHGDGPFNRIDRAVKSISPTALAVSERPRITIEDPALYIYTSGTTGLPKAANINHYRVMLGSLAFAGVMNTTPKDRMYDCLPMYHTAGGLAAIGALLVKGGSVVIREKFSAHEFWNDIVRHNCTLFQYIGELCRYLVNSSPHPNEANHHIRLACGNGLRPDVWEEFKTRFRIPHILEFYGATEGNVNMFNFEGLRGAIGRVPWFLASRFPTALVRFDVETEQPVRGADGFCIRCKPNEVGETIGKILKDASKPGARFEGYAKSADNEKKILRNVFTTGDAWFRTGDLMRQDERGYFYFVDRIGDTFRWKGENVSTSEVAEAIGRFAGIQEANVYGLAVAGYDGRAGMAALVCDETCDLPALHAYLAARLPDYARPVFLRIQDGMDTTGTFKQKKIDLVREGFDPSRIEDPVYVSDAQSKSFVPLDAALYARIQAGQVRL